MARWLERFTGRGVALTSEQLEAKLEAVQKAIAGREAELAELREQLPVAVFAGDQLIAQKERRQLGGLRDELETLTATQSAITEALAEARAAEAAAVLAQRWEVAAEVGRELKDQATKVNEAIDVLAGAALELLDVAARFGAALPSYSGVTGEYQPYFIEGELATWVEARLRVKTGEKVLGPRLSHMSLTQISGAADVVGQVVEQVAVAFKLRAFMQQRPAPLTNPPAAKAVA